MKLLSDLSDLSGLPKQDLPVIRTKSAKIVISSFCFATSTEQAICLDDIRIDRCF